MCEFHYKYIKIKCNVNLWFADTNSLVYEIETNDAYENFYENKNLFDCRNYLKDSKFLSVKKLLVK